MAEKPRGMRLKFVLPSYARVHTKVKTCSFSSKDFKRFYGEQDSVESNPIRRGQF